MCDEQSQHFNALKTCFRVPTEQLKYKLQMHSASFMLGQLSLFKFITAFLFYFPKSKMFRFMVCETDERFSVSLFHYLSSQKSAGRKGSHAKVKSQGSYQRKNSKYSQRWIKESFNFYLIELGNFWTVCTSCTNRYFYSSSCLPLT